MICSTYPRLASDMRSSCFRHTSVGIIGVCHQVLSFLTQLLFTRKIVIFSLAISNMYTIYLDYIHPPDSFPLSLGISTTLPSSTFILVLSFRVSVVH